MSLLAELRSKLAHLLKRSSFDDSLDQEIRSHIEFRTDELVAGGMGRLEAARVARREFGSTTRIAEESREAWRWNWMEDLGRDLSYATRALSRDRRFAFTAIISFALGIGVNTTIFSLASSFLLSEPSVANPGEVVHVQLGGRGQMAMQEFRFLQDSRVFTSLVGFDENGEVNWRSGDSTRRLFAVRVTDNFFADMRVPIGTGRPIQKGERNVVVVSDRFWRNQLSTGPMGQAIVLDGASYSVVGVLPPNHRTLIGLGFAPELYIPVSSDSARVSLYGRMPSGVKASQMAQRLVPVCAQLDRVFPHPDAKYAQMIKVDPVAGVERFLSKRSMLLFIQFFALLMIVVGLLLAIACTNVASLLLARAAARTRELGVRVSLGATRGRLIRQLLAESLLLSLAGAAAGLAINMMATHALNGLLLPMPVPIRLALQPDWRLLAYAIAIAIASAVMAGLLPALTSTRRTNASLKQEEHQVGGSARMRKGLVTAQVAVSVIVLVTAALFVKNLMSSTAMNPGFDLQRTTWAHMRLVPDRYPTAQQTFATVDRVLERVRALPGVEAAAYTNVVPLNDSSNNTGPITSDARKEPVVLRVQTFLISEDFFKTMGIALLAGRDFTENDRRGGAETAIINQALAKAMYGAAPAVGRTLRFGDSSPLLVVGVVADSKYVTLGEEEVAAIYEPQLDQHGNRANLSFLVRASASPSALTQTLNHELLALEPTSAVEIKPMNQALGFALLPSRAGAGLLGVIGVLGLSLAAIGLFGVLSYSVSRRAREIGLRMALGASPKSILRLVLGEGATIIGAGLAVGMIASLFVTRPLAMFLVAGLNPFDPLTYMIVALVMIIVGCFASIKPAIRALRSDPAVALRLE